MPTIRSGGLASRRPSASERSETPAVVPALSVPDASKRIGSHGVPDRFGFSLNDSDRRLAPKRRFLGCLRRCDDSVMEGGLFPNPSASSTFRFSSLLLPLCRARENANLPALCKEGKGPLRQDEKAVGEANQEVNVHEHPDDPGAKSGKAHQA
jgi:hypothetical protein